MDHALTTAEALNLVDQTADLGVKEFKGQYGGGCGAGRTTMGVEADGTSKGCPGLPTAIAPMSAWRAALGRAT